jgi:hypothetical protein
MVYFANFQHFTSVRLTLLHNQTRWATCFIRALFRITELRELMEWSLPWIPSSRLDMSCGVATCSYVCIPHVDHARQGYTPFKRRVSEVGRCPCSGFTHGYRFYKWTVMFVDAFVTCWHERFVFCRYTNHAHKSLSANRIAPTSYYKESRL